MSTITASAERIHREHSTSSFRHQADRVILLAMEGLLLALLCLSPWGFGAVHPGFEFLLDAGIAALLFLWAARGLLQGQFSLRKCPLAACLAALFILAVFQLVPWSKGTLSWLSPHTAELYKLLLPSQAEILPAANGGEIVGSGNSGTTLSLVPGATQQEAIRLLAILLLFVVVRNNLTSTAQLRRLSIVALANGLLLSVFAIIQFFTWGSHLIYGSYSTNGTVFGPFICRNHFPYYVNMCLGLGAGLILFSLASRSASRRKSEHSSSHHSSRHSSSRRSSSPSSEEEKKMEAASSEKIQELPSRHHRRRSSSEEKKEDAVSEKTDEKKEEKTEETSSRHRRRHSSRRRSRGSSKEKETIQYESDDEDEESLLSFLGRIVQEPRSLWLGFALTILIASIMFSVSRGGALAMLGGGLVCALIQSRHSASYLRLGIGALLIGFLSIGFVAWFGLDRLEERWDELYEEASATEDVTKVNRFSLWVANLPGVLEEPVWGTGYGTFRYTELLHREDAKREGVLAEHAHNDYLEAILEGGIVGLVPVLLLIGILLWYGYRAIQRQHRSSASWLATGVFFSLVTVLIHSFVDFGLHIPAITFFATVLCAHLAALGSRSRHESSSSSHGESPEGASSFHCRGLSVIGVASVLGLLAVVLVRQGWKEHKAERLRQAALALSEGVERPDRQLQIAYLQAAVQESPKSPSLWAELARAQMKKYQEEADMERDQTMPLVVEQGMSSLAGAAGAPAGLGPAAVCATALFAQTDWIRRQIDGKLDVPLLMPFVQSYIQARDNCPIMTEPHVRLAASAEKLKRGDTTAEYLDRARFLSPTNATIWYLCGKQEFQSERREEAYKSWRHSLEISDHHLLQILDYVRSILSDEEMLAQLLPDKPKVLFVAGMMLHADEAAREKRRPFLERALTALAEQPETPKLEDQAEDLFLKAMTHDILGQRKEALNAYQAALYHAPKKKEIEWRLLYAKMLYDDGQLKAAERQLLTVLTQRPGHERAKEMLSMVKKDIAKRL